MNIPRNEGAARGWERIGISWPICPSTVHDRPVAGPVHGFFRNPYDGEADRVRITYCERCAEIGEELGLFTRRYEPSLNVDLDSHIATFRRRQAMIDGGGYCCTPDSGDCCGPGGWCCERAGKHNHEDEL